MSRTTTQIKDQIVRKGASEIIEDLLSNAMFFDTQDELHKWIEARFDVNMLGQSDDDYEEVLEIMMEEVYDRVYDFFTQTHQGIIEKAFLVQKSLAHDTDL